MSNIQVKFRTGTAAEHDDNGGFTGVEGELTVDTTNDTLRVHDGTTVGGIRLAKHSELGTGGSTDLGVTHNAETVDVTSSTGDDITLNAAVASAGTTAGTAGVMTDGDKEKLDDLTTQTWDTSPTRSFGTTYTNNSNINRFVNIGIKTTGSASIYMQLQVNTSSVWHDIDSLNPGSTTASNLEFSVSGLVPAGAQYRALLALPANINLTRWVELG